MAPAGSEQGGHGIYSPVPRLPHSTVTLFARMGVRASCMRGLATSQPTAVRYPHFTAGPDTPTERESGSGLDGTGRHRHKAGPLYSGPRALSSPSVLRAGGADDNNSQRPRRIVQRSLHTCHGCIPAQLEPMVVSRRPSCCPSKCATQPCSREGGVLPYDASPGTKAVGLHQDQDQCSRGSSSSRPERVLRTPVPR